MDFLVLSKKDNSVEVIDKISHFSCTFRTMDEATKCIASFHETDTPDEILKKEIEWSVKTNQFFIQKARQRLNALKAKLIMHQDAFKKMNLKLYDAFYYECSDEFKEKYPYAAKKMEESVQGESPFFRFCEDYYNQFIGEANYQTNYQFRPFYVRFTSQFTLFEPSSGYLYLYNIFDGILEDFFGIYGEALDLFCEFLNIPKKKLTDLTQGDISQNILLEITADKVYEYFKKNDECFPIAVLNEMFQTLEKIGNWEEITETEEKIDTMIKVASLIKIYKEDQVRAFKNWLENYEDELVEEENEEIQKQQEIEKKIQKIRLSFPFSKTALEGFRCLDDKVLDELVNALADC